MSAATSKVNEELLEEQLLLLGRQELDVERKLQLLRIRGREMAQAGNLEEATLLWDLHDEAKRALINLQKEISLIERTLYGMRRKNK